MIMKICMYKHFIPNIISREKFSRFRKKNWRFFFCFINYKIRNFVVSIASIACFITPQVLMSPQAILFPPLVANHDANPPPDPRVMRIIKSGIKGLVNFLLSISFRTIPYKSSSS